MSEWIDVLDPGTGESFARVPEASRTDVDRAVAAARASFDDGRWRRLPAHERARVLWRIGDLLEENADELGRLESRNQGVPVTDAVGGLLPSAARTFRYYAGAVERLEGRASALDAGGRELHAYTRREPIGVAALIVPWNSPLYIASWKLAPALAAGCSAIVKPAEETPLSALRLAEICVDAGVPPDVVQVVTGTGERAGAWLAAHDDVDKVSFTGSTEVGRAIVHAAAGNLKKVTLELGGKSPVLVLPDADVDAVVPGLAKAIFSNAGQICTAGSRALIHESRVDAIVDGVCDIARSLRVGYGADEGSQMGPLISARHRDRVAGYVESGAAEGAEVRVGGKNLDRPGFFFEPTVLAGARDDMKVVREEVFGPVLAALSFRDVDEAVARANDTTYGLAASVWTQDIALAHRVAGRLRAGRIGVNVHASPHVTMPTGGFKQSGWGRELGPEGLEPYLEDKSVFVAS